MAVTPIGGGGSDFMSGLNESQAGGLGSVSSSFGPIYSMFGPTSGGGGAGVGSLNMFGTPQTGQYGGPASRGTSIGPGGITMQNLSTADNPLTSAWLSGANYLGGLGPTLTQGGLNLLQGGLPVTGTGLNMAGTGFGTTQQGLQTLAPSVNYWSNILSGNPQATAAAVGPTAANLSNIYSGALNQASAGMPAGGYRATTMASLPQAQAQQVGNAVLGLQPQAAQQLGALGGEISGIGTQQAGIGQGIAGTGLNISQLGQQLASMGIQVSETQLADILQKMNINYQAPNWQQSLLAVTGAIKNLAGGASSGASAYQTAGA